MTLVRVAKCYKFMSSWHLYVSLSEEMQFKLEIDMFLSDIPKANPKTGVLKLFGQCRKSQQILFFFHKVITFFKKIYFIKSSYFLNFCQKSYYNFISADFIKSPRQVEFRTPTTALFSFIAFIFEPDFCVSFIILISVLNLFLYQNLYTQ